MSFLLKFERNWSKIDKISNFPKYIFPPKRFQINIPVITRLSMVDNSTIKKCNYSYQFVLIIFKILLYVEKLVCLILWRQQITSVITFCFLKKIKKKRLILITLEIIDLSLTDLMNKLRNDFLKN